MQIPVEITFKEMERSDAVEARIRELAGKLERVYDRVIRCDVMIETPHRHQTKGRQYHCRVRLTVPGGKEIVASHDPGPDEAHEDIYVAIRDSFNAARRQLEDYARKSLKRGEPTPRTSSGADHGRISFLDVEKEWGWIEPDDGRRIYFHRNSVLGNVDELAVGDEVRFTEEPGNEGPQASSVHVLGAHAHHAVPDEAAIQAVDQALPRR
jgi:cold shock CspA family protein/ribosome-associated translation inhibitor RaiA